jgi:hypothetical protein
MIRRERGPRAQQAAPREGVRACGGGGGGTPRPPPRPRRRRRTPHTPAPRRPLRAWSRRRFAPPRIHFISDPLFDTVFLKRQCGQALLSLLSAGSCGRPSTNPAAAQRVVRARRCPHIMT